MTDNEKLFAITGRLHVILRREQNRIIDVEWISVNADYAREVLRLARAAESQELYELSEQVEELHPLLKGDAKPAAKAPSSKPAETGETKYTFSIR